MDINRHDSVELLLQETNCLISLPDICIKLQQTLINPNHTNKDIADIIMHDPALTIRLLRIVNSAYFGLSSPVSEIPHALGMIGEHELNNLILASTIIKSTQSIETSIDLKKFWKTSVFCAVLSRNIANIVYKKIKEEIFVAGLLLNIGKLVMYVKEPELLKTIEDIIKTNQNDFDVERQILGFDHANVGAAMAEHWNLSNLTLQAIADHHQLPSDTNNLANKITFISSLVSELIDFDDKKGINQDAIHSELNQYDELKEFVIPDLPNVLQTSFSEFLQVHEAFCGAH